MSTRGIYTARNKRIRTAWNQSYVEYLKSELWAKIRARVLKRDGFACRTCGKKATQVHHTNYSEATLSGRSLDALFAICRSCHEFIEFSKEGKKAHLFKEVRKNILLCAHLNGVRFVWPSRERRKCQRCRNDRPLGHLDDEGVCRRCHVVADEAQRRS